ncbi:MAG: hypothetical protein KDA21_13605 [Phycisphaerales bacterium]|nr:hypothetical protein [Phycisphaerales bacterium]
MSKAPSTIVSQPSWRTRPHTSQLPFEVPTPERFLSALDRARAEDPAAKQAREAAEDFVASTLVKPILAQMREMNNAAPPFAPGDHEKAFAGMIDDQVAARIVKAQRFPLVDRIAATLQKNVGASAAAAAPDASTSTLLGPLGVTA